MLVPCTLETRETELVCLAGVLGWLVSFSIVAVMVASVFCKSLSTLAVSSSSGV